MILRTCRVPLFRRILGSVLMKIDHLLIGLALLIPACKPAPSESPTAANSVTPTAPAAPGKLQVLVTNYPLQYFAQRIAGDAVEVRFPAPKDEDPAFWQPDDATVAAFQKADLILMNGASYSKWADKVTLPEAKMVDTSKAFANNFIQVKDAMTHSHGPGGEHSHSGTAFTTWIDFNQASHQAQAVGDALSKLVPAAKASIEKNTEALREELEALDDRLSRLGRKWGSQPLVASHPVYHYLARRYGMNLKAVLWEPGVVPDEQAMNDLRSLLSGHRAHWMIWEGTPDPRSVEAIGAAFDIKSIVFDPCANVPESGDWMKVMNANVEALEKAFP